jgi:hypothetical protein
MPRKGGNKLTPKQKAARAKFKAMIQTRTAGRKKSGGGRKKGM